MSVRRALAAALTCGCALALAGCDSDMSPSDLDVEGTWNGTWQFVTGGATVSDAVTARLTQDGANASGTWSAESGPTGDVTFTVGEAIAGTLTISLTTLTGATCTATAPLTGSLTSSTIEFTTTDFPTSGICQWAPGNRFSLRR